MNAVVVSIALLQGLAGAVQVDAQVPCVTQQQVDEAVTGVGGLLETESVTVVTRGSTDSTQVTVSLSVDLLNRELLERMANIAPHECADVADWVAFLLQQHRRSPAPAAATTSTDTPETTATTKLPEAEPTSLRHPRGAVQRQVAHGPGPEIIEQSWSACDGQSEGGCFGMRGSIGGGLTTLGLHGQMDVSIALVDTLHLDVLLMAERHLPKGRLEGKEVSRNLADQRAFAGAGVALSLAPYLPDAVARELHLSLRAHAGLSLRGLEGPGAVQAVECPPDEETHSIQSVTMLSPALHSALRVRYGYLFAELGLWGNVPVAIGNEGALINPPVVPAAYLAIGLSLFG